VTKLSNLSIRQQATSEFNINYRTLSRYRKIPEKDYLHENIVIQKIQVG